MQNNNSKISDEGWNRIAKYINNTNADSLHLTESELNEAQFLSDMFNHNSTEIMDSIDTNKAWDKLHKRIDADKKILYSPLVKIAAVLAVIVAGYLTFLNIEDPNILAWETSAESPVMTISLKDGSVVDLNRNSSLSLSNTFGQKQRKVIFTGEGYYKIAPDKKRPFIINTTEGTIRILGTSFSVTTRIDTTEIYVTSGLVDISTKDGTNSTKLNPGERATFTKSDLIRHEKTDTNYLAWQTKIIVINNQSLAYFAKVLEDAYHVNVIFKEPHIKQLKFTGTFDKQPLEVILENLNAVFSLNYSYRDNTIELYQE